MKFRFPDIFLGMLLAVAIFAIGAAFSSQHPPNKDAVSYGRSNEPEQKAAAPSAEDFIFGYPALDVFTGVLAVATICLGAISVFGIRNQSRDTRIIQRAYISADPRGVSPFERGSFANGHVEFRNVGNLPARNIRWFIGLKLSPDVQLNDFPIGPLIGDNVLPLGTEMLQWERNSITSSDYLDFESRHHFLYVWGEAWYDDGFGKEPRHTRFCHRYERRGLRANQRLIAADGGGAVYHQFGNDAD